MTTRSTGRRSGRGRPAGQWIAKICRRPKSRARTNAGSVRYCGPKTRFQTSAASTTLPGIGHWVNGQTPVLKRIRWLDGINWERSQASFRRHAAVEIERRCLNEPINSWRSSYDRPRDGLTRDCLACPAGLMRSCERSAWRPRGRTRRRNVLNDPTCARASTSAHSHCALIAAFSWVFSDALARCSAQLSYPSRSVPVERRRHSAGFRPARARTPVQSLFIHRGLMKRC